MALHLPRKRVFYEQGCEMQGPKEEFLVFPRVTLEPPLAGGGFGGL